MFRLNSHKSLSEYILRKLGAPVINVELADEQLDDCIYDAINYFIDRHYDGVEQVLTLVDVDDIVKQDGYVELPSEIVGVASILDATPTTGSVDAFERLNYLIANSEILNSANDLTGVESYVSTMRNIADIRFFFTPARDYEYNKATNRLHLRTDLTRVSQLGVISYRAVDPTYDVDLYNDEWLKRYATAKARVQWGVNLTKYQGQVFPGGTTLDATTILQKGEADLEKALEEFEMTYNHPPLPRVE